MTMTNTVPKRPHDPAQLAELVVDLATEAADKAVTTTSRAVSVDSQSVRGQAGGLKGGPARAKALNEVHRGRKSPKRLRMSTGKRSMDR